MSKISTKISLLNTCREENVLTINENVLNNLKNEINNNIKIDTITLYEKNSWLLYKNGNFLGFSCRIF